MRLDAALSNGWECKCATLAVYGMYLKLEAEIILCWRWIGSPIFLCLKGTFSGHTFRLICRVPDILHRSSVSKFHSSIQLVSMFIQQWNSWEILVGVAG